MGKYAGLYGHLKHPNVFYSLHKIGERHAGAEWRKLDRIDQPAAVPSTLQIWMSKLQPGDKAEAWAMLVHRLRQESSHTDNETVLPQPLHDAQKIKEYLSRYADDAKEDDDLNAIEPAPTEGSQ